ncbi:dTDP-4-dehydrorhamnose 3,5-epimerase [Nitratireductor sp. ZSWI3]|uniref:dTDP-4-dehydrorhamnose 3,5-epimerase n=1 Tax=Nitratireductor sp. ZSWI3 TaxID=2966359 RepID=UPI00215062A6|nr:dTDP-4-dehydrorhamnose 3,5-epimerase [Nitratireductor sp. ZSWI3]MCR4265122.1 dTDP-4-dehydrorhamnose 3,5-epimerase [Nitratireductor sp. ZSWI3]
MIEVRPLALAGVLEVVPPKFGDDRGYFSETYNREKLAAHGVDLEFVQDNQSYSARKGVLRGLHYQLPPRAQDKLVRVLKGRIFDVAVDIRRASPTFGRWVGVELSEAKWNQLLIPQGFAHGFVTLEEDTVVAYKVSDYYSPEHDRSIRYDDPDIGIEWPLEGIEVQLSRKDTEAPRLADAEVF